MRPILAALALFALSSCGSPQATLGVVNPPEKYVNYDPSTVDGGLAAPVGFRVFNALGTQAWDKFGTGNNSWTPAPPTAATSSRAGLVTEAQAAGIQGGLIAATFISQQIDMTTVADNIPFLPTVPGYYFLGVRFALETVSQTGTASGSLVYSVGNDASHLNIIPTAVGTVTSAGINAVAGLTPIIGTFNNLGGGGMLVDNATPIVIKVVTAPTGMTELKMRLIAYGIFQSTSAP